MTSVPPLTPRETAAWRGLQLMQMRLEAAVSRQLVSSSSLSYPDYVVLVVLSDEPEGRLRSFALAQALGWDKTRLSHHVKRMVTRGLVTKESSPDDRRGQYVGITERGREQVAAATPGHLATVRRLFLDQVTTSELDALAALTARVIAALDAAPEQLSPGT